LIKLEPLSQKNARAVVRLRVSEQQRGFVASNADSIADAYVHRELLPLAIYAGDELVGFAMYGQDPDDGRWWIIRFMIDERCQGRGYGRGGMEALIAHMRCEHQCETITLGVNPANHGAIRLYESLGFNDTGEVHDGEMIMRLVIE
jgi:diamine N-acetyltransferase